MLVKSRSLVNGFAIFSMFFGAGNVIFPLIVGAYTQDRLLFALLGLGITAVLVPFTGLFSMTLFDGDYQRFFRRIGKWPGLLLMYLVLLLIGPFGGIPRCITLTFSTVKTYLPKIQLIWFSIGSILLIFICSFKKQKIVSLLGKLLTPILLLFLGIIIIKGLFFSHPHPHASSLSQPQAFFYGLKEGYNTMDLLAAFFFSSIICHQIKGDLKFKGETGLKIYFKKVLKALSIGAFLLSITYIGFSFLASFYADSLDASRPDEWLSSLGLLILGPKGGLTISMVVALSCLTTSIALAAICGEFLYESLFKKKISYPLCLVIILFFSFWMSTLGFVGIVKALASILEICYPLLLGLTVLNSIHRALQLRRNPILEQ